MYIYIYEHKGCAVDLGMAHRNFNHMLMSWGVYLAYRFMAHPSVYMCMGLWTNMRTVIKECFSVLGHRRWRIYIDVLYVCIHACLQFAFESQEVETWTLDGLSHSGLSTLSCLKECCRIRVFPNLCSYCTVAVIQTPICVYLGLKGLELVVRGHLKKLLGCATGCSKPEVAFLN